MPLPETPIALEISNARGENVYDTVRRLQLGGCPSNATDVQAALYYGQYIATNFPGTDLAEVLAAAAAADASADLAATYAGAPLKVKTVRTIETLPVNLSAPGSVLGLLDDLAVGNPIGIGGQQDQKDNGVWLWNGPSVAMTRPADCATGTVFPLGSLITVKEGPYADQILLMSATSANQDLVIGTSPIVFSLPRNGHKTPPHVSSQVIAGRGDSIMESNGIVNDDGADAATDGWFGQLKVALQATTATNYSTGGTTVVDGCPVQPAMGYNPGVWELAGTLRVGDRFIYEHGTNDVMRVSDQLIFGGSSPDLVSLYVSGNAHLAALMKAITPEAYRVRGNVMTQDFGSWNLGDSSGTISKDWAFISTQNAVLKATGTGRTVHFIGWWFTGDTGEFTLKAGDVVLARGTLSAGPPGALASNIALTYSPYVLSFEFADCRERSLTLTVTSSGQVVACDEVIFLPGTDFEHIHTTVLPVYNRPDGALDDDESDATGNTATVTMATGTPGVVSWTSHGLNLAAAASFTTTGALLTGISAATIYWVVPVDGDHIRLASSKDNALNGVCINLSGTQSGVHTGHVEGTATGWYLGGKAAMPVMNRYELLNCAYLRKWGYKNIKFFDWSGLFDLGADLRPGDKLHFTQDGEDHAAQLIADFWRATDLLDFGDMFPAELGLAKATKFSGLIPGIDLPTSVEYTPTMTVGGGSVMINSQNGRWWLEGENQDFVHVYAQVGLSAISSPTGAVRITLPFAVADGVYFNAVAAIEAEQFDATLGSQPLQGMATNGTSYVEISTRANGAKTDLGTYLTASAVLRFSIRYRRA